MSIQIKGKIIGLNEEFAQEEKFIKKQVDYALLNVGVELQKELEEFIQVGVYDKYSPKEYLRRSANPTYGSPLTDEENFVVAVRKQSLEFIYEPTGEHKKEASWHERDGDKLIEWLQRGHKIEQSFMPARPFWNDFIDKQLDGGLMEKFIREMSPKYQVIPDETDENSMNNLALESYVAQD